MEKDVFKIFKDLELRLVGLDDEKRKLQEGYFVSFRGIGLPIIAEDYANPYTPLGGNLTKAIDTANEQLAKAAQSSPPVDPKEVDPLTASSKLTFNQTFSAAIGKSQQAYINTFFLVDDKLRMNANYAVMPGSSKLSDSWFAIVNGANGINSNQELNDEQTRALEAARSVFSDRDGAITPKFERYKQLRDAWIAKKRTLNQAYSAAFSDPIKLQNFPLVGASYQQDVDSAYNEWVALGSKAEIEKAQALLDAQGIDPSVVLIGRAKQKFINSLMPFPGIGQLPYTFLSPQSWWDATNDDGWVDYSSRDFKLQSNYESSSTSYGGGVTVHAGLWSGGAGFNHSDTRAGQSIEMQDFTIRFKYCCADIRRPWLDTSLLNLKNWFLVGDYKKETISRGTMGQEMPAGGVEPTFLPSLTTSLIFVKDVEIYWKNWKSHWRAHTEANSGNASVGVWMFTAKARYSRGTATREFGEEEQSETLRIPGIQLVGYVSAINPSCPQLDSSNYMKR